MMVPTPDWFTPYINSPLGLVLLVILVLYLLFYTTPVLGVLSLFVAYELLRRSSVMPIAKVSIENRTPSQAKKDVQLKKMNPHPQITSLEEELVHKMAPIGVSESSQYVNSEFKPVAPSLIGASLV
tara:strand:+ start:262 stop:639 length:378 start_codon:yes stop_codon:yes gene_type:complete